MPKITEAEYRPAFELALEVSSGRFTHAEAAKCLVEKTGMNVRSAQGYIRTISHILQGKIFHRTINNSAVKFILENIVAKGDHERLRKAIDSLNSHIEYYEVVAGPVPALRILVDSFVNSEAVSLAELNEELEREVKKSLRDSESQRLERIANASKKARTELRQIKYFIRNADIRAQVLYRADGRCEGCGSTAPFLRYSDERPYLEVHHRIPLAEDGDDTLENCLALCPNCHREAHHGIDRMRFRSTSN